MRKLIVFTDPNHPTCRIICPHPSVTPEEELERLRGRPDEYPNGVLDSARIIDESDIPTDRLFRNAWTDQYDTPTVDVDMDKARNIHMDRIREVRNRELLDSDRALMKALDQGNDNMINELKSKRQELRDLPQMFQSEVDECECPYKLKDIWPDGLDKHRIYRDDI